MDILDKNWLTSEPIDYEYKKYKLLSAADMYQTLIRGNHIYQVLEEIEYHLSNLYKFNTTIDDISNKLKVLKGIDIDTMSLSYEIENDSNIELESLTVLSKDAITFLEKIHTDVRGKWRDVEKQIAFTQIPDRKAVYSSGYIILITKNSKQLIYKFTKPSDFKSSWKSFKLTQFVEEAPYSIDDISSFVEKYDNTKTMIIRADVKKVFPLDTCIIPIVSHKLFNYLKVGA